MQNEYLKIAKTKKDLFFNEVALEKDNLKLASIIDSNYIKDLEFDNCTWFKGFNIIDFSDCPVLEFNEIQNDINWVEHIQFSAVSSDTLLNHQIETVSYGQLCSGKNKKGKTSYFLKLNNSIYRLRHAPKRYFSYSDFIIAVKQSLLNRISKRKKVIRNLKKKLIQNINIYSLDFHIVNIHLLLKRYGGRSSCEENNNSIFNDCILNIKQVYFLTHNILQNEKAYEIIFNRGFR